MILYTLQTLRNQNMAYALEKKYPIKYISNASFFNCFSFLHQLSFMYCYFIPLLMTVSVDAPTKYRMLT